MKQLSLLAVVISLALCGCAQANKKNAIAMHCIEQADAEKILGQAASLTESSEERKDQATKYRCTYTANQAEAATGKLGHLYYMLEQYDDESKARNSFATLVSQNQNMPDFRKLEHVGDEAIRHSDNQNFDMIIIRRGSQMLRLKVNRLTALTSTKDIQPIAERLILASR